MAQTALQELIQFMADNLYRGNAILYGKALELLEKEQTDLARAFDDGRHNGKYVLSNAPLSGREYYDKKYNTIDVNS